MLCRIKISRRHETRKIHNANEMNEFVEIKRPESISYRSLSVASAGAVWSRQFLLKNPCLQEMFMVL
jgi:hypothetical protein